MRQKKQKTSALMSHDIDQRPLKIVDLLPRYSFESFFRNQQQWAHPKKRRNLGRQKNQLQARSEKKDMIYTQTTILSFRRIYTPTMAFMSASDSFFRISPKEQ